MSENKIRDIIERNRPLMMETLRTLISIESVAKHDENSFHPYGDECAEALTFMLQTACEMGFDTTNYDFHAGTADWDKSLGNPLLGILCHLDVVPASPEEWSCYPYTMVVRDGCIYGRGAIDNKGPAVAVLYAMYALKQAGVTLKKNIRFFFGCDEESGSSDLEYYRKVDKMPPMVFTPDGSYPIIHIEKGMMRFTFSKKIDSEIISMNAGTAPNAVPSAAKAYLSNGTYKSYNGIAAHASTPGTGVNAITGLMKLLAEKENCEIAKEICQLFPHSDLGGEGLGIACEDTESGKLTCTLSMMKIKGGVLTGTVDIRYPLCTTKEQIEKAVRERLAQFGYDMDIQIVTSPHKTSENSDLVKSLISVFEHETGEKGECVAIGGSTYVHDIDGGVAFGTEMPGFDYRMHGNDERVPIELLMATTRMIANAILKICQ